MVTQTKTIYVLPPAWLLEPCARPELAGSLNRDLWAAYQARGAAIDECNADKARLRQWRAERCELTEAGC